MGKVIWTSRAKKSLQDIYDFVAKKDITTANKISTQIVQASLSLIFNEQFQIEERLGHPYRRIISGFYKIICIARGPNIYILTVFDTRQDPNKLSIK